jgi:hypothetical protein
VHRRGPPLAPAVRGRDPVAVQPRGDRPIGASGSKFAPGRSFSRGLQLRRNRIRTSPMDRAQASRLVGKLQALAADPAATEAEKALAGAKAEALSARFRLGVAEPGRPRRHARRRYRIRRVWVASPDTRWGSPNLEVEDWRGDWKITVDIGWVTSGASWSAIAAGGDATPGRKTPSGDPKGSPSDAGS